MELASYRANSREAAEQLCRTYWPLCRFVRQGFLCPDPPMSGAEELAAHRARIIIWLQVPLGKSLVDSTEPVLTNGPSLNSTLVVSYSSLQTLTNRRTLQFVCSKGIRVFHPVPGSIAESEGCNARPVSAHRRGNMHRLSRDSQRQFFPNVTDVP